MLMLMRYHATCVPACLQSMASSGAEMRAVSVGGAASAAQLRNIVIASQLQEVQRSLAGLLPKLPAPSAAGSGAGTAMLAAALDAVHAAALDAVSPLFRQAQLSVLRQACYTIPWSCKRAVAPLEASALPRMHALASKHARKGRGSMQAGVFGVHGAWCMAQLAARACAPLTL